MARLCPQTVDFIGIPVVSYTRKALAEYLATVATTKHSEEAVVCFSINAHALAEYNRSPTFRYLFSQADMIHADGFFIVLASVLVCDRKLPERVATTDWFHDFVSHPLAKGLRHYFLGGSDETLAAAITNARSRHPGLCVVGSHNGFFDDDQIDAIAKDIKIRGADVVWIGMGRPRQEAVALALRDRCAARLLKTCGGLFDFLAGTRKRAPRWLQKVGMEWFYRLAQEPRRLGPRYMQTNVFAISIVMATMARRALPTASLLSVMASAATAPSNSSSPNRLITFVNPNSYLALRRCPAAARFDTVYVDSFPMAKLLGLVRIGDGIRRSFDMTSLAKQVLTQASRFGRSVYFIGARQTELEAAIGRLRNTWPELHIVGSRNGYFSSNFDYEKLVDDILNCSPDIIIVGMGAPLQEEILALLREHGWKGTGYTCGGFLHQTAQRLHYYPRFFDLLQLRWLYRIVREPKLVTRYFLRYPLGVVMLVGDVLCYLAERNRHT